jgi:hypothetical protein
MSLVLNIARSYRAPGEVVAGLAKGDLKEPQVLFFGLLACGLIFVAQWPGLSRAATLDPSITFEQRMGGALFGVMFMLPLLLYGLAGMLQLALRGIARPVAGLHVRLSLFWALLAVSPLMLFQGGLSAFMGANAAVSAFGFVVAAAFLYILGAGLRAMVHLSRPKTDMPAPPRHS